MGENNPTLLFIKSGIVCAEPFGFYERVADIYDCDIVSNDKERLIICAANGTEPYFNTRETNEARIQALDKLGHKLDEGSDVLYNSSLNSARNREVVKDLAMSCGATVLTIAIHNSSANIHTEIDRRYEEGDFDIALEFNRPEDVHRVADLAAGTITYPGDEALHLDGFLPMWALIDEVVEWVRESTGIEPVTSL